MHSFLVPLIFLSINLNILNSLDTSEKSSKSNECEPVSQKVPVHGIIMWDTKLSVEGYYISTPICLDEKFNFKTRKCASGSFESEFTCENVQKPVSKCPTDSTEIEIGDQIVCYYLTEPINYSELNCKYKYASSMAKFANDMNKFMDSEAEVWYPASKMAPYNVFIHDEITENYKSIVAGVEYEDNAAFEANNCLKINSDGKKMAVSCDDKKYAGLCIFKILADIQEYSLCRLVKESTYSNHYDFSKARCLSFKNNCNQGTEPAEYLEPFQNFAITYEANKAYRTALQSVWGTNTFHWSHTSTALTYAAWSSQVEPNIEEEIYSNAKGWALTKSIGMSVTEVCQDTQLIQVTDIQIELPKSDLTVTVRVSDDHRFFARIGSVPVMCFTNTAKDSPISRIDLGEPTFKGNVMEYQFTMSNGYRGRYWCEGFQALDFFQHNDLNKGYDIDGAEDTDNYVIFATVLDLVDPEQCVTIFKDALHDFFMPMNVKWAALGGIDKAASTVTYILHIWPTAAGQGESDERIFKLEEFIKVNVDVLWTSDVFSSYYCRAYRKSDTNEYDWEKTQAGQTKTFTCTNGVDSITRDCLRDDANDFVRGMRWSEIKGVCPPDDCGSDIINGAEWNIHISTSEEGEVFISTPICLDEQFGYMTRLKKENCFEEAPECNSLQTKDLNDKLTLCPPGFELFDSTFCYAMTAEVSRYPPTCEFPNNLSPAELTEEVILQLTLNKDPIWYPARRYDEYKFGYTYFLYDVYNALYKQPIGNNYQVDYDDGEMARKKCLILKSTSGVVFLKAVPCDDEYYYLCIYKPLQDDSKSYCQLTHEDEKCYHSEFKLEYSKCFCPRDAGDVCTFAEFPQEYQTYKVGLTDTAHRIGMKFDGRYAWTSSNDDLKYSRWSKALDPNKEVFISYSGWSQGNTWSRSLCQFDVTFKTSTIELKLVEPEADKFIVVLTNPKDIVKSKGGIFCFTDSGAEEIITAITDVQLIYLGLNQDEVEEELYTFEKATVSGHYWCEVFQYPNFLKIESNSILVSEYSHYVFLLTITFEPKEDPTSPDFVRSNVIAKLQSIFADAALDFVTVAWSGTKDIIEEATKEVIYCLNLKTNKQVHNNEDELNELEKVLDEKAGDAIGGRYVDLKDFSSSHYCRSMVEDEIPWPTTNIGEEVTVQCQSGAEGEGLTRECEGDFANGARWGRDITGSCSTLEDYDCEPTVGTDVKWDTKIANSNGDPKTNYYISTPICLDESFVPLTRTCNSKIFADEPTCRELQNAQISRCPDGLQAHLIDDLFFCIAVTEKMVYEQANCPYKNTVPFTSATKRILETLNLDHPVWYPASRNARFGFSYLMGNELSMTYMSSVNAQYLDGNIVERDCAIITPDGTINAVRCTDLYNGLCVYASLDQNTNSYCALTFAKDYYNSNFDLEKMQCLYLQDTLDGCHSAELLLPYQNFIIPITEEMTYQIGICLPTWCSEKPLKYSYWSKNLMFEGDNNYLGLEGWQQKPETEENVKYICERSTCFADTSTITLTKSKTDKSFYVEVTNPRNIVVQNNEVSVICFTDAVHDDLLARIVLQLEEHSIERIAYTFESPVPESPGYYWCEAFTYPEFINIKADDALLIETFNNYPFYAEFSDYGRGENPLVKSFVTKHVLEVIQNKFTAHGIGAIEVRWMKTVDIDARTVKYLLHLTTRTRHNNEDELKLLNDILQSLLEPSTVSGKEESSRMIMGELRSSSYCKTLGTNDEEEYKWHLTPIGKEAKVQCLYLYESAELSRKCDGDFMTGGLWGEIVGTCPKPEDFECEPVEEEGVIWDTKISKKSPDIQTSYYISTPICLDEFRRPKTRLCREKEFGEAPPCFSIQQEIGRCPENLLETKVGNLYYCYYVTDEESRYPPTCRYKNTIPFKQSLMLGVLNERVWYPATRDSSFGVSYLMADEPSEDYMLDVNASYLDEQQFSRSNCAVIEPDGTIKAADCDTPHKALCVYLALGSDEFSSCSLKYGEACYNTNFDLAEQRACHCREPHDVEQCNIAELLLPYQNFIIPDESDEVYEIRICKTGWCSHQPFEYSFWSRNLMYDGVNNFLSLDGWRQMPAVSEQRNFICDRFISYSRPILTISEQNQRFTVILLESVSIVYRHNFDVICFTDAVHNDLLLKIKPELQETSKQVLISVYTFANKFPEISANYWCEIFEYPHLKSITATLFYNSGYNNYVVKICADYKKAQNPLSKHFVEQNVVNPLQDNLQRISKVRWMKTLQVNDKRSQATYLIHLTTQQEENNEEELESLQRHVKIAVALLPGVKDESDVMSSSYCPADGDLWRQTECGQTAFAKETCLEVNGKVIERTCGGDFMNGCQWWKPTGTCSLINEDNSPITNDLYDLLISNKTDDEVIKLLIDLTARKEEFKVVDVLLTAIIFEAIAPDCITTSESGRIIHNVMNIDGHTLRDSQLSLNATDKILYHFDYILLHKVPSRRQLNAFWELIKEGDVSILLFDAKKSDVNGLSIVEKNHKLTYNLLPKNLTDLNSINEKDLILATHIPVGLINQIGKDTSFVVRLTVFLKDTLFNENVKEKRFNGGKNIGILLPEIEESFTTSIPLILRPKYELEGAQGQCGLWKYGFDSDAIRGSWWNVSSHMQILQDNIRCDFEHTTHFAFLVMGSHSDFEKIIIESSYALLIITTIECALSILGIVGIFTTAILFKTWRRNKGNQILLQLSLVTFFQFGLLYVSGAIKEDYLINDSWCFSVGVALHYTVLAQFCWMLVIAYLQYKRFVHVFKQSQSCVMLKSCVVGYLLPAAPILWLVFNDRDSYLDKGARICYPSGDGLTYTVLLPIGCVILINILLFACIIFNIFFPKSNSNAAVDDDLLMLRFRLVFVLFFMLGMTWIFGILGQMTRNIMFLFLFSLTASLQGFILFLFFIVFNKRSRRLYVHYFKIKRYGA